MTPPVAIALAYGVVWSGVLLYLLRLRRRLREAAADAASADSPAAAAGEEMGGR